MPLAVLQWKGIVALNYPGFFSKKNFLLFFSFFGDFSFFFHFPRIAKNTGITRFGDSIESARRKCPSIQFVHVELIEDNTNSENSEKNKFSKVSLERYRNASLKVFNTLKEHVKVLEKASIDEAYCDITEEVNKIIDKSNVGEQELNWVGKVLPNEENEVINSEISSLSLSDLKLLIGSRIIDGVRTKIKENTGYTCSAGIAHNKMLAKIIASKNKPNGQTILRSSAVSYFMSTIKLRNIKFLGGKLGRKLEGKAICTPEQKYTKADLVKEFSEKTGNWLYLICRGIDHSPVETNSIAPKSIMAAKSFSPLLNISDIQNIVVLLCIDLIYRMKIDQEMFSRVPGSLAIGYVSIEMGPKKQKTLSAPMIANRYSQSALVNHIVNVLSSPSILPSVFPCIRLTLQATNFRPIQKQTISTFFVQNKSSVATTPASSAADSSTITSTSEQSSLITDQDEIFLVPELPQKDRVQNQAPESKKEMMESPDAFDVLSNEFTSPLTPSQLTSQEAEIDHYFYCQKCSSLQKREEEQIHNDFHFAEELQNDIEKERKVKQAPQKDKSPEQPVKQPKSDATVPLQPIKQYKRGIKWLPQLPEQNQLVVPPQKRRKKVNQTSITDYF